MLPRKSLVLGGTICGVLALFIIGGLLISSMFYSGAANLTAAQKKAILTQIMQNNSTNLYGRNSLNASGNSAAPMTADSATLLAPLKIRGDSGDYNYRVTTSSYASGAAAAQCKLFQTTGESFYKTLSYEYYGDNNLYYSKYITEDKDNDLTAYNLTKSNENNSETINYQGGSYAVRWKYDFQALKAAEVDPLNPVATQDAPADDSVTTPDSAPLPTTQEEPAVDYDALILQYFGPEADVVDVINQNGKTYYLVQYSYDVDCTQGLMTLSIDARSSFAPTANTTSDPHKVVVQNMVDSESFEIVKSNNYLDSVSAANLLDSYSTSTQTSTSALSEVENQFNFEYDVEIKDKTTPDYNAENEANVLDNYLAKQNLTLVLVSNADAKLQGAYSSAASQDLSLTTEYMYDRNFYAKGSKGDQIYNKIIESLTAYATPVLSTSYVFNADSTYDSVNIDAYKQTEDVQTTLKGGADTVESKMNINIDGVNVEGTLYTYTYKTLVEDSGTSSSSDGNSSSSTSIAPIAPDSNYVTRQLYLEFSGNKYIISLPSRADFDLNTLKFKTIKTSDASQMAELANAIKEVYVNGSVYLRGGAGVSEPSAKPL